MLHTPRCILCWTDRQVGNLTEVLIPFIKYTMRVKAEKRGDGHGHEGVPVVSGKNIQRTQAEKGLYLEQYDRECCCVAALLVSFSPSWM